MQPRVMRTIAVIFGTFALVLGLVSGTTHNIMFGLMVYALAAADYYECKSERNRNK